MASSKPSRLAVGLGDAPPVPTRLQAPRQSRRDHFLGSSANEFPHRLPDPSGIGRTDRQTLSTRPNGGQPLARSRDKHVSPEDEAYDRTLRANPRRLVSRSRAPGSPRPPTPSAGLEPFRSTRRSKSSAQLRSRQTRDLTPAFYTPVQPVAHENARARRRFDSLPPGSSRLRPRIETSFPPAPPHILRPSNRAITPGWPLDQAENHPTGDANKSSVPSDLADGHGVKLVPGAAVNKPLERRSPLFYDYSEAFEDETSHHLPHTIKSRSTPNGLGRGMRSESTAPVRLPHRRPDLPHRGSEFAHGPLAPEAPAALGGHSNRAPARSDGYVQPEHDVSDLESRLLQGTGEQRQAPEDTRARRHTFSGHGSAREAIEGGTATRAELTGTDGTDSYGAWSRTNSNLRKIHSYDGHGSLRRRKSESSAARSADSIEVEASSELRRSTPESGEANGDDCAVPISVLPSSAQSHRAQIDRLLSLLPESGDHSATGHDGTVDELLPEARELKTPMPAGEHLSPLRRGSPGYRLGTSDCSGRLTAPPSAKSQAPRPSTNSTTEDETAQILRLKASFPWLMGDLPATSGNSSMRSFSPPLITTPTDRAFSLMNAGRVRVENTIRRLEEQCASQDELRMEESPAPKFKVKLRRRPVIPRLLSSQEFRENDLGQERVSAADGAPRARPVKFKIRMTRRVPGCISTSRLTTPPDEPDSTFPGMPHVEGSSMVPDGRQGTENAGEVEPEPSAGMCGGFARKIGKRLKPLLSSAGEDQLAEEVRATEATVTRETCERGRTEASAWIPPPRLSNPSQPASFFSDNSSQAHPPRLRRRISSLRSRLPSVRHASSLSDEYFQRDLAEPEQAVMAAGGAVKVPEPSESRCEIEKPKGWAARMMDRLFGAKKVGGHD